MFNVPESVTKKNTLRIGPIAHMQALFDFSTSDMILVYIFFNTDLGFINYIFVFYPLVIARILFYFVIYIINYKKYYHKLLSLNIRVYYIIIHQCKYFLKITPEVYNFTYNSLIIV